MPSNFLVYMISIKNQLKKNITHMLLSITDRNSSVKLNLGFC